MWDFSSAPLHKCLTEEVMPTRIDDSQRCDIGYYTILDFLSEVAQLIYSSDVDYLY